MLFFVGSEFCGDAVEIGNALCATTTEILLLFLLRSALGIGVVHNEKVGGMEATYFPDLRLIVTSFLLESALAESSNSSLGGLPSPAASHRRTRCWVRFTETIGVSSSKDRWSMISLKDAPS